MAEYLGNGLRNIDGITIPAIRKGCTHDYLLYCIKYDSNIIGISRSEFIRRLEAEGLQSEPDSRWHVPPIYGGFVKPIHLQPVFQNKVFRPRGYPWSCNLYEGQVSYDKGICPIVEDLYENSLICITSMYPPLTEVDMDDICKCIEKVSSLSRR